VPSHSIGLIALAGTKTGAVARSVDAEGTAAGGGNAEETFGDGSMQTDDKKEDNVHSCGAEKNMEDVVVHMEEGGSMQTHGRVANAWSKAMRMPRVNASQMMPGRRWSR